ncbi:hypothetical protein P7C73_g1652, partial [Tremellales sp. Uapishka_1]
MTVLQQTEASSSKRITPQTQTRAPSTDRQALSPQRSPAPAGRRVRTVPPTAKYDPPTPPGGHTLAPPISVSPPFDHTSPRKKRPRPKLRYSTSGSDSGGDDDDDDDTSDDEPPWWTFTNRGMQRVRAKVDKYNEAKAERHHDIETGDESEAARGKGKGKLRRGSRESRKLQAGSASHSEQSTPNLLHPAPVRPPHSMFKRSFRANPRSRSPSPSPSPTPRPPPPARSNSAPASPHEFIVESVQPGIESVLDPPTLGIPEIVLQRSLSPPLPISPRRQQTLPETPRLTRFQGPGESLTDSEATPGRRRKLRNRLSGGPGYFAGLSEEGENESETPSLTKPVRPKTRRNQTTRLRINLPDPLTRWPQVGSWQDALNGEYEQTSRKPSINETAEHLSPMGPMTPAQSPERPAPARRSRRSKSRRTKRYRQALVPPTPGGLGFIPRGDEVQRVKTAETNEDGYDWERRLDGALESDQEKAAAVQKRGWWVMRGGRRKGRSTRIEPDGWRKRWRRVLFLDARVTIWIRLINLIVVVVLLGESCTPLPPKRVQAGLTALLPALSVTIRDEQRSLSLPGVLGSSTTLIIAYSALTILHVLTAIYREYFGKPIGLWGLRSKMLWVCLDLLFVALWSSAMSLATNDYIGTPLQCSSRQPWWRAGLSQSYQLLMDSLDQANDTFGTVIPTQVLTSSLTREICRRQIGCITFALIAMLLYGFNMVLSLFRIFETVRRTANLGRAVMV